MGLFSKNKEEQTVEAPPMPPAPPMNDAPTVEMKQVPEVGKLSVPLFPGENTFSDIKTQVTSQNNRMPTIQENNLEPQEQFSGFENQDSLFDISDLEIEETTPQQDISFNQKISNDRNEAIDTNIEREGKISFISSNKAKKTHIDETFYITTSQFKSLIEITENVKIKVKDAADTHLRLMDIKSEEDIEYESLRKAFQYIEDKLYEVDSLIFDK